VGVIIAQLFLNIQHNWSSEGQRVAIEWLGGATAMALALTVMQVTKTVHPPGGATALIAVTNASAVDLSWYYISVVTLSAVIQVIVGCLVNNIERKYPQYWWTPHKPIQIDSTTLSTLMPPLDNSTIKEDIDAEDLSTAEEGASSKGAYAENLTVFRSSTASSSTLIEITNAVDQAIMTLQKFANDSQTKYALILPNSPLIITPDLVDESEQAILARLMQKIDTNTIV
jgi:hypothetical protein